MVGDLISLRMVVVVAGGAEQELWRQGVAMASVPIEFAAQDPRAACGTLAKGRADICILDDGLPDEHKLAVVKAARQAQPVPLVFVSAARHSARMDGVDGVLGKPDSLDDARKLAEICIRTKIPTRVLIVDDSSTMRGIVRKILRASRFALDIHEAAEGIAALNELRSGRFGLVFLDYNMPGLNGFETLSGIRRESAGVAVVMMTSTVDSAIVNRAHAAGALGFLKKPFYPADIDRVLERYYGVHVPMMAESL